MLIFNWFACVIIALIAQVPVSDFSGFVVFLLLIQCIIPTLAFNGSNGAERPLRMVSDEQGRDRQLLVWLPIQSHVPPVGPLCIQSCHFRRVR
jgi:hypothetical protein